MSKHIVIDARIRRASTGRPVDRLLNYLPKLDKTNNFTILVEPNDPITFSEKNFNTLPCPYKQFSLNPLQQLTYAWQLNRLRPDLVFFTLTGQAPLLYSGKNITLTHDLTMLRYARAGRLPQWLHWIRMIGYRLLFWKGNRSASRIIVPSNFVADDLSKYMKSALEKISVIYESSEPPLTVKSEKIKVKRVERPFIFHVGSPFPHKNIHALVQAFELVKQKHPELQLVLAGKKEYYFEELEDWIKKRIYASDIIIPGFISDAELKWLYENAEMYVLPSLSEGFGLPGLEAMAHGCPLASSNATCLPEIYGNAAVYFDPSDQLEMAKAIEAVLKSQKLRKELILRGKKQLKNYSWEKMSKEIADLIISEL